MPEKTVTNPRGSGRKKKPELEKCIQLFAYIPAYQVLKISGLSGMQNIEEAREIVKIKFQSFCEFEYKKALRIRK